MSNESPPDIVVCGGGLKQLVADEPKALDIEVTNPLFPALTGPMVPPSCRCALMKVFLVSFLPSAMCFAHFTILRTAGRWSHRMWEISGRVHRKLSLKSLQNNETSLGASIPQDAR
jgi:hypothetical protein